MTGRRLNEVQIREVKGRREADFLDAQARERAAKAKANEMVSKTIAEGNIHRLSIIL